MSKSTVKLINSSEPINSSKNKLNSKIILILISFQTHTKSAFAKSWDENSVHISKK